MEWDRDRAAGEEWLKHYRSRHTDLKLKKPEACSLSRATSFNKSNVSLFFNNLKDVFQKKPELGNGLRIFNLDETALGTVQVPQKVLADSATRRLNKVTSAERGQLVTACCIICSNGTFLPPVLVFPRRNFKPFMLKGAPNGTLGLANPTGWMVTDIFQEVMEHFIKHSNTTPDNPSVLIFDNHESHLGPVTNRLAKEHGVYVVTIPPHCSDKIQPLDIAVYRSTKSFYNAEMDKWMCNHPGKTITIYEVAELFGAAFYRSMTPSNICSAFKTAGIFPFNPDVFAEELYLCSQVTDRPNPLEVEVDEPVDEADDEMISNDVGIETLTQDSNAIPSSSSSNIDQPSISCSDNSAIACFGLPKASPRKRKGGRKRGRSTILTNTPVLEELEKKAAEKAAKVAKKDTKFKGRRKLNFDNEKQKKPGPKPIKKCKKKRIQILSSEESNSEGEDFVNILADDINLQTPYVVSDFCLVKFMTEEDQQIKHYVGQIIQLHDEAYEISFLRRVGKKSLMFSFPNVADVTTVAKTDVLQRVLPLKRDGTARQNRFFTFNFQEPINLY